MPKKPFVDFRDIRSRISMEQVLEHYGVLGTLKRTGDRLSGPCPIHKGSNPTQFRVETKKNLWHCFSECNGGGNVLDFIAKMEDISIHDAALKACEWYGIALDEVKTSIEKSKSGGANKPQERSTLVEPKPAANPAPSSDRPQPPPENNAPNPPLKFTLDKLQREHPYLTNERGLTLETIVDFGLGYFTGQKGLMVGRVVIPINNVKGELVAYAGRWPGEPPDSATPKYKLPPFFKKGQELFNLDRAIKEPATKPLVIVEGFFDVIKLHQNGWPKVVALMGSSLSTPQEELIRQYCDSYSHVIVMLDEDEAGKAGRENIACRLAQFCFVRVRVFQQPGMQPEYLSQEQVQQIVGVVP